MRRLAVLPYCQLGVPPQQLRTTASSSAFARGMLRGSAAAQRGSGATPPQPRHADALPLSASDFRAEGSALGDLAQGVGLFAVRAADALLHAASAACIGVASLLHMLLALLRGAWQGIADRLTQRAPVAGASMAPAHAAIEATEAGPSGVDAGCGHMQAPHGDHAFARVQVVSVSAETRPLVSAAICCCQLHGLLHLHA
eukprot:363634-Chlamydomonas_euryale.AAC.6